MRRADPRRDRRARRGAALLEALIAMVILAVAGAAVSSVVIESSEAVARSRAAEAELRRADGFFSIVALWPREDLDRHLGDRPQGPWRLRVQRETPLLYTLALTDSTGARTLLRTAVYRAAHDSP